MTTNVVVQGFSLTNRWLLYTSFMLTPAQFLSGVGSNLPTNLGFLAYNWYTQVQWYQAIQGKQLHALSLLPIHFNFIYAISYLGGVSSGNLYMGILLGLGTAGVIVLNTVSAWTSWATNMQDGFGVYEFFFFGWRRLTHGWHTFFLLWQIADSVLALNCVIMAIVIAVVVARWDGEDEDEKVDWFGERFAMTVDNFRYPAIPLGAVLMMFLGWPLILWTELIVARNHIESETDMVAVWLFVAQTVSFLIPSFSCCLGCFKSDKN